MPIKGRSNKGIREKGKSGEMPWFQKNRARSRRKTELQKESRKKNRGT
jgi:hypothetical protein